jgi:transcriptional regulator NrdR family protein
MREQTFNEIEAMKQELLQMGYYQFQVDSLVREVVHTTQLRQLSTDALEQLAAALKNHLAFARKCHGQ